MITLYHVSYELSEPLDKEFIPRIPQNTIYLEDETTARICFSDSIKGCIRAIKGCPNTESGFCNIIVWEYECDENDENLVDWKQLYYSGSVPDAAVTHEYWYLKKLYLKGKCYRIFDIKCEELYSFDNKYKEKILNIIESYVDDVREIENLDPCTIINEWIDSNLNEYKEEIINRMKEAVTYEEKYESFDIFEGKNIMQNEIKIDYVMTKMITDFKINLIDCILRPALVAVAFFNGRSAEQNGRYFNCFSLKSI